MRAQSKNESTVLTLETNVSQGAKGMSTSDIARTSFVLHMIAPFLLKSLTFYIRGFIMSGPVMTVLGLGVLFDKIREANDLMLGFLDEAEAGKNPAETLNEYLTKRKKASDEDPWKDFVEGLDLSDF